MGQYRTTFRAELKRFVKANYLHHCFAPASDEIRAAFLPVWTESKMLPLSAGGKRAAVPYMLPRGATRNVLEILSGDVA